MNHISVKINGKNETLTTGQTLQSLLDSKGINPNVVACELNTRIVKRAQLGSTVINEGDEIEILQMIGGG